MKKLTTLLLCMLFVLLSAMPAMALELDDTENSEAASFSEAALAEETSLSIPVLDKVNGKLLLFKDFEQENATTASYAYMDTNYMTGTSVSYASASGAVAANPNGTGSVLQITPTDSWVQTFIQFSGFLVQPGKYRVVYDYYSESNCTNFMERCFTTIHHSGTNTDDHSDDVSTNVATSVMNAGVSEKKWITKPFDYSLLAEDLSDENGTGFNFGFTKMLFPYYNTEKTQLGIYRFGIMPAGKINYCLDNIKVYHFPEAAVIYDNGGELVMLEYETETVTIPVPSAVDSSWNDENFKFWTDGENYYFPGEEYAISDLGMKSLTAVFFEQPLYDEELGDLVLLYTYEGAASAAEYTYKNPAYFGALEGNPYIRNDGLCTYALTEDNGDTVVSVKTAKKGVNLFGYIWQGEIASAADLITLDFDYKLVSDRAGFGSNFWVRICGKDGGESYLNSGGITYPSESGVWTEVLLSRTNNVSGYGTRGVLPQWNVKDTYNTEIYVDDFAVYVKPAVVTFSAEEDGEALKTVKFIGSADTLTFPTIEEFGISSENFVGWTNGRECYDQGETIPFINTDHPSVTDFYPFYQDASQPAVISLFEGNTDLSVSKTSYTECIEDDGRDVNHIHYWGTTWTKDRYCGDPRTHFTLNFDAAQYGIIDFMVKNTFAAHAVDATNKENTEYTERDSAGVVIYNYYNDNYGYSASSRVGVFSSPVDGEYHIVSIDMRDYPNATYPWEDYGYGFAFDVNDSSWAADTYIDYVRIYRCGFQTVTYDTNAPEDVTEEQIISEVSAETGRGLGTGYLLTGARPEIEGYVFKGWATSADSTETVTQIDLTGDATLYAVWEAAEGFTAAEVLEDVEIRGTGYNNGIRFKAAIVTSVKDNLSEIGFIATREVLLPKLEDDTYDYDALTFELKAKGSNVNYFAYGKGYDSEAGMDKYNGSLDDGRNVYTTVVTGIPLDHKNENMVVRSYVTYDINGKAVTVYGNTYYKSLYDAAKAVKDEAGEAYQNNKDYIDSIVPDEEE